MNKINLIQIFAHIIIIIKIKKKTYVHRSNHNCAAQEVQVCVGKYPLDFVDVFVGKAKIP